MTEQEIFELKAQAKAGIILAEQAINIALAACQAQGLQIDFGRFAQALRLLSDHVGAEGTELALARRANEIAASSFDQYAASARGEFPN